MIKTYRLTVAYDGTRYRGWQRQGNTETTIQAKLEAVLSKMTGHAIEIHGAGRTDAGVHAKSQIASTRFSSDKTPAEIAQYLNTYLPNDIAVLDCTEMHDRFHARLNAKGKRYCYRINDTGVPDVFRRNYSCMWDNPLDLQAMQDAAQLLLGTHDFRGFSSVNKRFKKSTTRTISSINIVREGREIAITYTGTGFLYNMIRILTGTLVEIGQGTREKNSILTVLETLDRQNAGITMPPQGLTLEEVYYESYSVMRGMP